MKFSNSPHRRFRKRILLFPIVLAMVCPNLILASDSPIRPDRFPSLTFHASFDQGIHADFAKGDPKLFTLTTGNQNGPADIGLNTDRQTKIVSGLGIAGSALEFTQKEARWIFFKALHNVAYAKSAWHGTVSFWMRLDPETDLKPGYSDPIQITPRAWNDAAFFVDFDKEGDPRDFRLGAFADLSVWNAENKPINSIPESQRPLLVVKDPPFDRQSWTHVVFTWQDFNSDSQPGKATLYLNGESRGSIEGWKQHWSWREHEETRLFIGLNYIGLFDELTCFNKAFSPQEVVELYQSYKQP